MNRILKYYFVFCLVAILMTSCSLDLNNTNTNSSGDIGVSSGTINTSSDNLISDVNNINTQVPSSMNSGMYLSHVLFNNPRTKSSSTYDITSETELWLMPTERGWDEPIASSNVENINKYFPNEDNEFIIPETDYPDSTFVIFVMYHGEDDTYNVLGMLSLETDDGNFATEFPARDDIDGVISFGYASLDDSSYIAKAQNKLEANRDSFDSDILEELNNDTTIHNAGLMALNTLLNSHENSRYIPGISFKYSYDSNDTIDSSNDIDWSTVEIRVFSDDTNSELGLFRPDGEQVGNYVESYGENSSVKWAWDISYDDFQNYATPRNLWFLKTTSGEVLAEFDLSVMSLMDDNNNPIIPLIDPTYATEKNSDNEDIIDTLNYNWYYFGPDGTTKSSLSDADQLDRLIDKGDFWFQTRVSNSMTTYMFREPSSTNSKVGGMEGDLVEINNISPELTVDSFFNNLGYHFSLNNIEASN